jgi:pimeloyl-ACP methyl ester carboxylesterase
MPIDAKSGIYYELHGAGRPLLITLPLMASHAEIFGEAALAMRDKYLAPLIDRYQVLLVDYPSIGKSRDIAPEDLTADRVCADLLSVASAAGFDRFAYWGYSWSGAVGLQLASRTDRLTAFAIGGWPPLEGPYAQILQATRRKIGKVEPSSMVVLRSADQYRQWSYYYESMLDWREAEAVAAIACPKLVYFGALGDLTEADISVPIASLIRKHRKALEAAGWVVVEHSGFGHDVVMQTDLVVPPVAAFLDQALGARV